MNDIETTAIHEVIATAEQDGYSKIGDRLSKHRAKIRDRKSVQTGRAGAAAQIAEGIRGVMLILQKSLDAEMISLEQARAQRDMLDRCRGMAAQISQAAQHEIVLLDGEDRGLLVAVTAAQALAREAMSAAARAVADAAEDEEYRNGRDAVALAGGNGVGAVGDADGGLVLAQGGLDLAGSELASSSAELEPELEVAPKIEPEPEPEVAPEPEPVMDVSTEPEPEPKPPPIVTPLRGGRRRRAIPRGPSA